MPLSAIAARNPVQRGCSLLRILRGTGQCQRLVVLVEGLLVLRNSKEHIAYPIERLRLGPRVARRLGRFESFMQLVKLSLYLSGQSRQGSSAVVCDCRGSLALQSQTKRQGDGQNQQQATGKAAGKATCIRHGETSQYRRVGHQLNGRYSTPELRRKTVIRRFRGAAGNGGRMWLAPGSPATR